MGHFYRCTQNTLVMSPSFASLSTYFLHLLLHRRAEKWSHDQIPIFLSTQSVLSWSLETSGVER